MDIIGSKEDMKNDLLNMIQSLRSQIQLDIDLGRPLTYLRLSEKLKSERKSSVTGLPVDRQLQQTKPLTIEGVREELGDCQRCPLSQCRINLVFGEGNPDAKLVFVGEAPGADEDAQGRPFVGRAGQLLTKIISAMGLSRKDVYICNILKCRPPGNRNPNPDEIRACEPFLIKQLQVINPKVICALGTFAAKTLLKTDVAITVLRGRFHLYHDITLMPTYHPAYLLRNPGAKKQVWEDIQMIMEVLGLQKIEA